MSDINDNFYYKEWPMSDNSFIRDGDIRLVTIDARVVFEETDKIVADVDENDEPVEFKDGFLMHILDKTYVYRGEETVLIGQSCLEDSSIQKKNNLNFERNDMKDFTVLDHNDLRSYTHASRIYLRSLLQAIHA